MKKTNQRIVNKIMKYYSFVLPIIILIGMNVFVRSINCLAVSIIVAGLLFIALNLYETIKFVSESKREMYK